MTTWASDPEEFFGRKDYSQTRAIAAAEEARTTTDLNRYNELSEIYYAHLGGIEELRDTYSRLFGTDMGGAQLTDFPEFSALEPVEGPVDGSDEPVIPSGPPAGWVRPPGWPAEWLDDVVWAAIQAGMEPPIEDDLPLPEGELPGDILGGTDMTMGIEEKYGRWPGYARAMGLGTDYWNPAQRWQASQYTPYQRAYDIQARLAEANVGGQPYGEAPGMWSDYLAGRGGGDLYETQAGLLSSIYGMTPGQRGQAGLRFVPEAMGTEAPPGAAEAMSTSYLQSLLAGALRPHWGLQGAGAFAQRIPGMQQAYGAEQAGLDLGGDTVQRETFLDYLRRRGGLGRYF